MTQLVTHLSVDTTEFAEAINELRLGLEPLDVLERFPRKLLRRLQHATFGGRSNELVEFGPMAAGTAGELGVSLLPGRLLNECLTTLRAMQRNGDVSHG